MDYFQGDPIYKHRTNGKSNDEGFDWEAWLDKHTKNAEKITPVWVEEVVKEYKKPGVSFACVGYVFLFFPFSY